MYEKKVLPILPWVRLFLEGRLHQWDQKDPKKENPIYTKPKKCISQL